MNVLHSAGDNIMEYIPCQKDQDEMSLYFDLSHQKCEFKLLVSWRMVTI